MGILAYYVVFIDRLDCVLLEGLQYSSGFAHQRYAKSFTRRPLYRKDSCESLKFSTPDRHPTRSGPRSVKSAAAAQEYLGTTSLTFSVLPRRVVG